MKVNFWEVSGYHGFDDYDGSFDDNLHTIIAVDARFKDEEILAAFYEHYKKNRVVALSLELKETKEI